MGVATHCEAELVSAAFCVQSVYTTVHRHTVAVAYSDVAAKTTCSHCSTVVNMQCENIASHTNDMKYARTKHIYIYRQFSVITTSVGLAALAPII